MMRARIRKSKHGVLFFVSFAFFLGQPMVGSAQEEQPVSAWGKDLYMLRCASCHGFDGRTPTDVGRGMYPRTPDLGSPAVQQWSDAELFWIIKHGIRLTGMPGFGKIHSDEEIWHLVHYIRSIPGESKSQTTPQKAGRGQSPSFSEAGGSP